MVGSEFQLSPPKVVLADRPGLLSPSSVGEAEQTAAAARRVTMLSMQCPRGPLVGSLLQSAGIIGVAPRTEHE